MNLVAFARPDRAGPARLSAGACNAAARVAQLNNVRRVKIIAPKFNVAKFLDEKFERIFRDNSHTISISLTTTIAGPIFIHICNNEGATTDNKSQGY